MKLNHVLSVLVIGLTISLIAVITSIPSGAQTSKSSSPELIVLTKRDGTQIPAELKGNRLYRDPNMDAYVVFGRDMILIHNKATDEIFPISIGGMKDTMYKGK